MKNFLYRLRDFFYRVTRSKTVGVRVLLLNENKILLVKHSYRPMWYMPGGGVNCSESPLQAAKREVKEEVGLACDNLELFGFYHSVQCNPDDYVALYVAKISAPNFVIDKNEIAQAAWFDFDKLPEDISPATKRRVEEYLERVGKSDRW